MIEQIQALRRLSRRDVILQHAGLGGMMLLLVAVPAIDVYRTWAGARAEKRLWTIAGPACPVVVAADPRVVGHKPPKTFTYNKVSFTRSLGDVSCAAFREDGFMNPQSYSVCQFSGPGAVAVDVGGRRTVYQPGPGQRTTVTIRHGQPSCVVGGWFARRPRGYVPGPQ
ncbi:hypothetical protein [Phenylobacterium sp.]|uniref:hypothetical protein n=1 Tax=Phenylobacterium sp. TaxID=1871053 RepID=UPI0025EF9C0F|nr:hypothetical protein [Phenylobacterium sp.]